MKASLRKRIGSYLKRGAMLLLSVLLILPIFSMTACDKGHGTYTKEEVEAYVRENLPFEDFTVRDKTKENADGDTVWTVKEKGGAELEIHVTDNLSQGLFSSSHYLSSDYDAAAIIYLAGEYGSLGDLKLVTKYSEVSLNNTLYEDDATTLFAAIVGSYDSRAALEDIGDEVAEFLQFVQNSEYPVRCRVILKMESEVRSVSTGREMSAGDYDCTITRFNATALEDAEKNCMLAVLDYRMPDWMSQFTAAEFKNAVRSSSKALGVCHGDPERDSYDYYEDLAGTAAGVSYRTLYELLRREDCCEFSGDPDDYTFTGIDGSVYRFSTAFVPGKVEIEEGKTVSATSAFYLKDGGAVQLDSSAYQHVSPKAVERMTGLSVYVWKFDYQPNANVYTESGHLAKLTKIYLNGEEMTYLSVDDDAYFGMSTDDYKYAWYDEARGTYMLAIDLGWKTDKQSYPAIVREYVENLDGSYARGKKNDKVQNNTLKAEWVIGSTRWSTKAEFDDTNLKELTFKKNGKKKELDYVTKAEYASIPYWLIGLRIDDFASLFDLSYTVDEEEGAVYFKY